MRKCIKCIYDFWLCLRAIHTPHSSRLNINSHLRYRSSLYTNTCSLTNIFIVYTYTVYYWSIYIANFALWHFYIVSNSYQIGNMWQNNALLYEYRSMWIAITAERRKGTVGLCASLAVRCCHRWWWWRHTCEGTLCDYKCVRDTIDYRNYVMLSDKYSHTSCICTKINNSWSDLSPIDLIQLC